MKKDNESGMTLVETMIAMLILLSGLLAAAQVLAVCVMGSKTYGRDSGKATAAAHDKMEELIGLKFSDIKTDLTVAPPNPATGVGLTAGGNIHPADPVSGYADYLDASGNRTDSGLALYTRQWQIVDESATSKRIAVSVNSKKSFKNGTAPSTILVTQKTQ
jgi:hypothetical protein